MVLSYCLLLNVYLIALSSDRDDSSLGSPPPPSSSAGHRPWVGRITQKNFEDSFVVRTLVRDMKDAYRGPYHTWSSFPPELRGQLWERFQSRFSWQPEETDSVRDAWEKANIRRITQTLNVAYTAALKSARTDRISMTRGHGPRWMNATVWEGLILHWSSEEWRTTSAQSSRNRHTEKEGGITKHSGGSISFARHRSIMETELARAPTQIELFQRTHKKKEQLSMSMSDLGLLWRDMKRSWPKNMELNVRLRSSLTKMFGCRRLGARQREKLMASEVAQMSLVLLILGLPQAATVNLLVVNTLQRKRWRLFFQQRLKEMQDEMFRRGGSTSHPPPAPNDDDDDD